MVDCVHSPLKASLERLVMCGCVSLEDLSEVGTREPVEDGALLVQEVAKLGDLAPHPDDTCE
jgi:hypothetical protein